MRVVVSAFGYNPSVNQILMFIGTVSIVVGALAALGQSNFKRMLAYSSISQIGYIIVGLGTGTALGMIGAAFHFFNHAIFKSLLFVNSAAVEEATGTVDMERLGGLSDRMPVTGTTSVVGLLSACGIPPLAGFWSKLIIIVALWQAGDVAYAAIAVLASALTLAYLLSMQRRVFFGKLAQGLEEIRESCPTVQTAAIALALITLGVGIFFPFMFNNLISPVKDIFLK
jgi:multicomponent Na+:H+ antiporter subunit D